MLEEMKVQDSTDTPKTNQGNNYKPGIINNVWPRVYVRRRPIENPPDPVDTISSGDAIQVDMSYKNGIWVKIKTASNKIGFVKSNFITYL